MTCSLSQKYMGNVACWNACGVASLVLLLQQTSKQTRVMKTTSQCSVIPFVVLSHFNRASWQNVLTQIGSLSHHFCERKPATKFSAKKISSTLPNYHKKIKSMKAQLVKQNKYFQPVHPVPSSFPPFFSVDFYFQHFV